MKINAFIHTDLGLNIVSECAFLGKTSLCILLLIVFVSLAPMALQAQGTWGNPYIYGGGGPVGQNLDSPDVWADFRFTAFADIAVDQFGLGFDSVTGAPELSVSLYHDNRGIPGDLLSHMLQEVPVLGNIIQPILGHRVFAAPTDTSVNLSSGSVYHLVLQVSNGSEADKIFLNLGTGTDARFSPQDGSLDPSFNRLLSTNGGSTWTVQNSDQATSGMYEVILTNSTSGDGVGQPLATLLLNSDSGVGGDQSRGQEFIFKGPVGQQVESVSVRLRKGSGDPAGDLRVLLLDSSNAVLSNDVLLEGGTFTDTAFGTYSVNLASAVNLTEDETYRLVLCSPNSTAQSYDAYFGKTLFSSEVIGDGATFQGIDGFKIGGTDLGSFASDTSADMYFELGLVPEPSSAALLLLGLGGVLARRSRQ